MLPDPSEFINFEPKDQLPSLSASTVPADAEVIEQINMEMGAIDHSLETFLHAPYRKECLEISPEWLFKEASPKDIEMFKDHTAWDEKNQTLIIKIYDHKGQLISYKRMRYRGGKWMTRKGTHPNKQCINGIRSENGPIYIVEGHHDALTGMLLHQDDIEPFNFLMIPTVGYTSFGEDELELLTGRSVYFLPDLGDTNDGSVKGMTKLASQVTSVATHTRVVSLKSYLKDNGIKTGDKIDLSEAIFLWKDGSKSFISTLLYYCDRGIVFDEEAF